jgi:hypothetical protein
MKAPKGKHWVKGHLCRNPKPLKNLGQQIDDKLKEGFKKSALW